MGVVDLSRPITQAAFGEMVGISQPAVSDFLRVAALGPGVTAHDMLLAYCARLREQAAGRLGDELGGLDLVQERAALAREQRLGYEIKNAVARKEYAPITLLAETLAAASQAVVEHLDQLPSRLKKACPDLPEAARDQVLVVLASARNEWVGGTAQLVVASLTADQDDEALTDEGVVDA